MADTRVLLDGLIDYRSSIERHLQTMESEFQALQSRWNAFSAVYSGDAADEFKPGWAQTAARFDEYIVRTRHILKMLDERIESLREVNRQGGI